MTINRRGIILGAGAIALAAPAVRAQALAPMKLTLNFLAGGPSAGFIYARKLGLYERAGINLTIEEGRGSATTAQMVATGQSDVGYADAPAAMQVRSRGAPVKVIAPILQTNAFAIMSLEESNIRRPQDLVGRKLAVQPGTAQTTLLNAIIAATGVDRSRIELVNIDPAAFIAALLEKRVDAILGGADFQAVQLRDRGARISEILFRDAGVPTVGLSVIARDDRIVRDGDLYMRFVAASFQGWDAARKNPEAAAQAVFEGYPAGSSAQYLAQLNVNIRFLCAPGSTGFGRVPDANWAQSFQLMTEHLELPRDKPIGDYFTNDLLPADAPSCS